MFSGSGREGTTGREGIASREGILVGNRAGRIRRSHKLKHCRLTASSEVRGHQVWIQKRESVALSSLRRRNRGPTADVSELQ